MDAINPSIEAIRAYREKLKNMTPEERQWAKIRLNSDYHPVVTAYTRLYPVAPEA